MIDIEDLQNGFRIGEWRVRPRLGTMARQADVEYPSRNALRVLLILASKEGRFVGRSELVDAVWDSPALGNVPLNRCMHELSTVFDDPSYVRNVPGRGYRVGQPVILEPEDHTETGRRRSGGTVALVAGAIAVLLSAAAWLLLT